MRFLIALLLLVGCQSSKIEWTPTNEQWEAVRESGTHLRNPDGSPLMFMSATVIDNLLTAKRKLEEQSGLKTELAVEESAAVNAFAKLFKGKNYIVLSTALISQIGHDQDALAAVMGHEMAHLVLGPDEEIADDQGLKWVMAAGYDPCGQARLFDGLREKRGEIIPLLSSHPSFRARAENARKLGKNC